jgi:hypothetical protein
MLLAHEPAGPDHGHDLLRVGHDPSVVLFAASEAEVRG